MFKAKENVINVKLGDAISITYKSSTLREAAALTVIVPCRLKNAAVTVFKGNNIENMQSASTKQQKPTSK